MEIKTVSISSEKEYEALREEVIKRLETQSTLLNFLLTATAALFGFGISNNNVLLLIPALTYLLFSVWKTNNLQLFKISNYIIKKFEGEHSNLQWESYNRHESLKNQPISNISSGLAGGSSGIFLLISFISIVLGISRFGHTSSEIVLLIIDLPTFFMTVFVSATYGFRRIRKSRSS